MTKKTTLALFLFASLLPGCSAQTALSTETYVISRSGVLLSDETFDVIDVYGFSDNREVARQITDFLNESEDQFVAGADDPYFYYPRR